MGLSKREWREHFTRLGVWDQFVSRRELLAEQLGDRNEAWKTALSEFEAVYGEPGLPVPNTSVVSPTATYPTPEQASGPEDVPAQHSASPPVFTPPIADAAAGWQPPLDLAAAMAPREAFPTQTASAAAEVQWVAQNICIEDIAPADAPSPMAWTWLWAVRTDREVRREFFRTVYPRLIPKSFEDSIDERLRDDNRSIHRLIDRLERVLDSARAPDFDGPAGEPAAEEGSA